jgi:hypothetical protein
MCCITYTESVCERALRRIFESTWQDEQKAGEITSTYDQRYFKGYWLLVRGGIVQSVPCTCDHILIYCCAPHPSSNLSWFVHQSSLLWLQLRHLLATQGESGREVVDTICLSVSQSYLKGSWICSKILRHGADGFSSLPKEVELRFFIVLNNPSLSAEFEPANVVVRS